MLPRGPAARASEAVEKAAVRPMHPDVLELRAFYASPLGSVAPPDQVAEVTLVLTTW